jgi:hypothetical protein
MMPKRIFWRSLTALAVLVLNQCDPWLRFASASPRLCVSASLRLN